MTLTQRLSALRPVAKQELERVELFGEWTPDLPDYENQGLITANNVIPAQSSYKPFPGLSAQSNALDNRARGAVAAKDVAGNTYLYAGDASALYQIRNQTVEDHSKAGGYSTSAEENWEFVQFGNSLIATNFDDPVQTIRVGDSGSFGDLITSTLKPKARHLETIRDFLVLGNTNDGTDGPIPYRVWWSALNDSTDFDPSDTTLSGFQDIPEAGAVQRIVGGAEYALVFLERQIYRMTRVSSPLVFTFDPVDRKRGVPIPGGVIELGRHVFFITEEGFFYQDGTNSHPIGANRVDDFFWNQFDSANAHRVSGGVDFLNKLIVWAFPGTGAAGGAPNKLLMYNWKDDKWSDADVDTQVIVRAETQAFSLDDLDSISTDIDSGAFDPSFDSAKWQGGVYRFAAFDSDNKLSYFIGDNLAATFETADKQLIPGVSNRVVGLRPYVDGGTVTCEIGGKDRVTDSVTYDSAVTEDAEGRCPVNRSNRYHRARVKIAAGGSWTHAQAVGFVHKHLGTRGHG